ncbi:hypothetical protein [Mangrovibacterium diazotrophicum]|uniref:hypothetical protein n=1 Tax=Mangrovibacterium diazotrophicum TaxID=1261403 RepID=UPI0011C3AF04|nr:hypothetical protein [Mangrovibacterium diazotrophicum]
MKKSIISCLLVLLTLYPIFGQQISPANKAKQETYREISHRQQKTGWILLGVGLTTTVVGAAAFNESWDSPSNSSTDIFGFLMLGGVISTFSSIPFFISAGANKRRAYQLSFDLSPQPFINSELTGLALKPQPGFRITVKF